MTPGDRIILKFRPITGRGEILRQDVHGMLHIRLEDGMRVTAFESDLLPDLKPDLNYGNKGVMGRS